MQLDAFKTSGQSPGRVAAITVTPRAADLDALPAGAWLDASDFASLLGVSRSTFLRWRMAGKLPPPEGIGLAWRAATVRDFLNGEVAA